MDQLEGAPRGEHVLRIGVVADTHGYMDAYVLELFAGSDLILHAGDIGDRRILDALEDLAPVVAVAGNMAADGSLGLPTETTTEIAGIRVALGHKRKRLAKRLRTGSAGEFDLVVSGHDHVPSATWVDGALWLDPGSATAPYEEDEVPTVAIVECVPNGLGVRFVPVKRRTPQPRPRAAKQGKAKS